MVGPDAEDPASLSEPGRFGRDYAAALKHDGLRGKRIGVVRSLAGFHEGVDARFNQAFADLRAAGAEIVDLLVSPTDAPAWVIDLVVGDRFLGGSSSVPARAGHPHITDPMGFVHGLPVGLSFFGAAFSEATLIEAAFAYEQATGHARPPSGFGDWRP